MQHFHTGARPRGEGTKHAFEVCLDPSESAPEISLTDRNLESSQSLSKPKLGSKVESVVKVWLAEQISSCYCKKQK